jgi:hypothetical protein
LKPLQTYFAYELAVLVHLPSVFDCLSVHSCIFPRDLLMDAGFTEAPAVITDYFDPVNFDLDLKDLYILIISRWAKSERLDAIQQPPKFILPLLEIYVRGFQGTAAMHYHDFLNKRTSAGQEAGFWSFWTPLRDAIANANLPFDAFKHYDSFHANGAVQKSSKLRRLSRRFNAIERKVTQMEQHMRDELQLQVGHLSLQESRESIKQSKKAIEESKRVKMRM